MIEPHVEHGGASSWFCIAANDDSDFTAAVGGGPAAAPPARGPGYGGVG